MRGTVFPLVFMALAIWSLIDGDMAGFWGSVAIGNIWAAAAWARNV